MKKEKDKYNKRLIAQAAYYMLAAEEARKQTPYLIEYLEERLLKLKSNGNITKNK